ncbi:unnamed protein product [Cylindrotheca closterium]|uniref:4'-phosphopantetheinyl transferase domain-containing protein n=1 Tax=Cylindrotheca closterium TaxID=2856 RepID=A0AAD2FC31_9STRA|nr:unnamed protein product [Cylindrotheca closterium]
MLQIASTALFISNNILALLKLYIMAFLLAREARALSIGSSSRILLSNHHHVGSLRRPRPKTSLQAVFSQQMESLSQSSGLARWLDIELPEGRCVGVGLEGDDAKEIIISAKSLADPTNWAHEYYHPDELVHGMTLPLARQESFWLGRLSMRLALDGSSYKDHAPILRDTHGRPQLPLGTFGSISHKGGYGAALVSRDQTLAGVGVDLEYTSRAGKKNIGKRVLTDDEMMDLGKLPGISAEEEVLLRFSLKEAIYKAAHPLLCQYVGFKEAEVTPHPDGSATCKWMLESGMQTRIAGQTAHWRKLEDQDFFLTSASVEGTAS